MLHRVNAADIEQVHVNRLTDSAIANAGIAAPHQCISINRR